MTPNKCAVIITTINSYEDTSIKEYSHSGYDKIIVGDKKTPHDSYMKYQLSTSKLKLAYIHPDDTRTLFGELSSLMPYNHYCRKNMGYLYAVKMGYEYIVDTDDDTFPTLTFDKWREETTEWKTISGPKFPNVTSFFTDKKIWPRGYPINLLKQKEVPEYSSSTIFEKQSVGIVQSLVNGDPDVDAICRMTCDDYSDEFAFDKYKGCVLKENVFTQGNTQASIWLNKKLFFLLYIPCTVSFRFCDILKMYIAQKCMWKYKNLFCYISPIFYQKRNEHDLLEDFDSEHSMHIHTLRVVNEAFESVELKGNKYDLYLIYERLAEKEIVQPNELDIVKEWLKYFD